MVLHFKPLEEIAPYPAEPAVAGPIWFIDNNGQALTLALAADGNFVLEVATGRGTRTYVLNRAQAQAMRSALDALLETPRHFAVQPL